LGGCRHQAAVLSCGGIVYVACRGQLTWSVGRSSVFHCLLGVCTVIYSDAVFFLPVEWEQDGESWECIWDILEIQ
jgi:hypothetical protein